MFHPLFVLGVSAVGLAKEMTGFLKSNELGTCQIHYTLNRVDSGSSNAPLIVWLQGGPGLSSLTARYFEIGPTLLKNGTEIANPNSWTTDFNILFLDAPEGTGLSSCKDKRELPALSEDVAHRIRIALSDFYDAYPDLVDAPLFIAGEDYAGHLIPPLASLLLTVPLTSPLRGVAIGNGHTHPVTQVLTRSESAKYFGLTDNQECYAQAFDHASKASFAAESGEFERSFDERNKLEEIVKACSMGANLKDIRTTVDYKESIYDPLDRYLNNLVFKLGSAQPFASYNPKVSETMRADVMRSMIHDVERILDSDIPVLLYQGLFDWIDGVYSNEAWMMEMKWKGAKRFYETPREKWSLRKGGEELAGYVRSFGALHHVVIRNAGHLVAMNQPEAAHEMIQDFVLGVLS